jgi:hypothetical protein
MSDEDKETATVNTKVHKKPSGFVVFIPDKLKRGKNSIMNRMSVGDSVIVNHKDFKRLYNTVYQYKRRHEGTDFEYMECLNGYVLKRVQ